MTSAEAPYPHHPRVGASQPGQARARTARRHWLVALAPEVTVPVVLHWHQWQFGGDSAAPPSLLEQVGSALQRGARAVLEPVDGT